MRWLVLCACLVCAACEKNEITEARAIYIQPDSLWFFVPGVRYNVTATTNPPVTRVDFLIRDTTIARLDSDGGVTALDYGNTYLIASTGSVRDSIKIIVPSPIIEVVPDNLQMKAGEKYFCVGIRIAHVRATTYTMTSSNTNVANIATNVASPKNPCWEVRALNPGVAYLVLSVVGDGVEWRDSAKVLVSAP